TDKSGKGSATMKVAGPLVPPDVVTVTSRGPKVAEASTTSLAVAFVASITTMSLTVMPAPACSTSPAKKFVPVNVTSSSLPRAPTDGTILVRVGCGGSTVKDALAAPPAAVSLTAPTP